MSTLKVFSTFTGIGGFEVGIHNASVGRGNVEFVGYSEIDKYACQVYEQHFKGVKNYGDITKIKAEALPDFDCLVGGFPCQAFSIAGRRAGFDDTRGTLFFDLARILRAKQPRLFVFENVKGLLNHDGGRTFRVIVSAIDELGYDCQWQVLNSKNHGVPQNRERIIIVGHLRGTARPQVFPITAGYSETINQPSEKGEIVDLTRRSNKGYRVRKDKRAGTLDANYYKGIANQERPGVIQINQPTFSNDRVYAPEGISPTLNTMQGGRRQPKIITGNPKYKDGKRTVVYTESDDAPTIRATQYKSGDNQPKVLQRSRGKNNGGEHELAPTITGKSYQDNNHLMQKGEEVTIRRLTPLECERLQAFPDNWTANGVDHEKGMIVAMSDTQRYKMCGNAVTTNVIQAVFERII